MVEHKAHNKKMLVGNDILPRGAQPRRTSTAVQHSAPRKTQQKRPKHPAPIQEIKRPLKRNTVQAPRKVNTVPLPAPKVSPVVMSPKITNHQALINAIAFDMLVIVMLGYVALASSWSTWVMLVYAAIVLLFRVSSLRMYISAAICVILLPIFQLLNHHSLVKPYAIFTAVFICVGSVRLALEFYKKRQTTHNA